MSVLKDQYVKDAVPALMKKFEYKSVMQVPKLEKVVINIGLGDTRDNPKDLENAIKDLSIITGQKPVITKAKKSIAAFKLREGTNVGCKVTLRGIIKDIFPLDHFIGQFEAIVHAFQLVISQHHPILRN